MSVEASVEIGTSGELFEDISNPCRESELRLRYNKMKMTMWPKCLKEIEQKAKASREGAVDKNEEKQKVKRMIKEVFAQAANDMMEKKMALESFFKISDKKTADKKEVFTKAPNDMTEKKTAVQSNDKKPADKKEVFTKAPNDMTEKKTAGQSSDKKTADKKEVFTKAPNDMMEKKTTGQSSDKKTADKKRLQCFDMAVQSLQLMIFWEECTRYQDMYKQLGQSSPDYLCELADQCYKQGCLMELHNPPLTLDWDNSGDVCPFPDVTTKSVQTKDLISCEF